MNSRRNHPDSGGEDVREDPARRPAAARIKAQAKTDFEPRRLPSGSHRRGRRLSDGSPNLEPVSPDTSRGPRWASRGDLPQRRSYEVSSFPFDQGASCLPPGSAHPSTNPKSAYRRFRPMTALKPIYFRLSRARKIFLGGRREPYPVRFFQPENQTAGNPKFTHAPNRFEAYSGPVSRSIVKPF